MFTRRSSQARRPALRGLCAAALLALIMGSAAPARAAPPQAGGPGVTTYTVTPYPSDPITLCPGQTSQVAVRVTKQVTRMVPGQPVIGLPTDVPRTTIAAESHAPSIASVAPRAPQTVGLQFNSGAQGRSPHLGAWFTVTALKPGDAFILFEAVAYPNTNAAQPNLAHPNQDIQIKVECQFKVSLRAAWTIPGEDLTHDASFYLPDVVLAPDADGNFQADAAVPNQVARGASIVCPGSSSVNSTKAHFSGTVVDGVLHINVTFDGVPGGGSESCVAQGRTSTDTPDPLSITQDISSGARHFFFQLPHILQDEAGPILGQTLVYIDVLSP